MNICPYCTEQHVILEKTRELYTGVPVDVYNGKNKAPIWTARFWYFSGSLGKCVVICWDGREQAPFHLVVNVSSVRISYNPVEPPPMPRWAVKGG